MEEVKFYRGKDIKYTTNKNAFKDGIYFAEDTKKIYMNDISFGSIEVADSVTATENNVVKGSAIYKAINDNVNEAFDKAPFASRVEVLNVGIGQYKIILLDSNNNELWTSNGTIIGDSTGQVAQGGITLTLVDNNPNLQIKKGVEAIFKCYFNVTGNNGYSLGNSGIIKVYKDTIEEDNLIHSREVQSEERFDILIPDDYLDITEKKIFYITATSKLENGEEKTVQIRLAVTVVDLSLNVNGYQLKNKYKVGDMIYIPYNLSGYNAQKTVQLYLDGELLDIQHPFEGDTFTIDTTNLQHGTHNAQLLASYETSSGDVVYSNLIYISLPILDNVTNTAVFGNIFNLENQSSPLINQLPTLVVDQYSSFTLETIVYNQESSRKVEFYSQGQFISDYIVQESPISISYKYNTAGTKLCTLICDEVTYSFNVEVIASEYHDVVIPNNPSLYLTALGKSNSSESRNSWSYGDITSTFSNFKWGGDGWISQIIDSENNITEPALRLITGDKVEINYKPLQQTLSSTNAFACNIKFKVSQTTDEEEVLISCFDTEGSEQGIGFQITSSSAYLKSKFGSTVATKFAPGQVYNIGFVSYPILPGTDDLSKIYSHRLFLYVNGVICSTTAISDSDSIYQNIAQNITINTNSSILDIFSIRMYETQLTDMQMFNAYLIDLNNKQLLQSEYKSNQVLDLSSNVSVEKALQCGLPCVIITGEKEGMSTVDYAQAMNNKDTKYPVDQILYLDSTDTSNKNFLVVASEEQEPILRLQGTSSLNYAIKNFRIYSKKAKMFTNFGYDLLEKTNAEISDLENSGALIAKSSPKYSMSENAAPVTCWCLKADFAESSSSHNTGFANLVHDMLTKVGSLTPPQAQKNSEYPYSVRTTVEGHPCLLFSRKKVGGPLTFVGKFNFNNDKSTEEVYGFLDINGYHDNPETIDEMTQAAKNSMVWGDFESTTYSDDGKEVTVTKQYLIDEVLKNNPTECWEFCNNENEFGAFKNIDFDKISTFTTTEKNPITGEITTKSKTTYNWINCWEARFPDKDELNAAFEAGVKPRYLKLTAEWLCSTDTEVATNKTLPEPKYGFSTDSAEYRLAKFTNELQDYFDITFLCDYYALNDAFAGADQRQKNMMWAFWYNKDIIDAHNDMGKMRCYPIYYDNDTILGVDNSGAITVPWDADEETKTEGGSYVFAGHDSVLWKNLRTCFRDKIKASFVKLRVPMDDGVIKKYFNDYQSDKYGEVIFNKDTLYKYISPETVGTNVILEGQVQKHKWSDMTKFIHGSRKAHRDWFINKRMKLFDNMYASERFTQQAVSFKGPLRVGQKPSFTVISGKDDYYAIYSDLVEEGWPGTIEDSHRKVLKGETFYLKCPATPGPGQTTKIYGISSMEELDFSDWGGFNSMGISGEFTLLKKFIFGGKDANPNLIVPPVGSHMPNLEYLDVTNTTGEPSGAQPVPFTSLNLKDNLKVKTVIARMCPYLQNIEFAEGGAIERVVLPTNYSYLFLKSLPNLTNSGIEWETGPEKLIQLVVENCPKLDSLSLLMDILNRSNSLQRVRVTDLNLSGNGQDLIEIMNRGIKGLESDGKTQREKCSLFGTYKLTTLLEDAVYNKLVAYFDLDIQQPEYTTLVFDINSTAADKITNLDNLTGQNYLGTTYSPSGHISRILEKRHSYMVRQPEETTIALQLNDNNSNYYYDGSNASIDGSEGDYCMYEPYYRYKGINDILNGKQYLLFSSKPKEEPLKQAEGKKVYFSDCIQHTGLVQATAKTLTLKIETGNSYANYRTYQYVLNNKLDYKKIRIQGIANNIYGAVFVDNDNNVLKGLRADSAKGMYDGAYLISDIPENTHSVYFTINTKYTYSDYCIYLTKSEEIEAIEPDWVEHEACFVGRLMSTKYNNEIKSAIYNINQQGASAGSYPYTSNFEAVSIEKVSEYFNALHQNYYPVDYEVLKDIIILAYATYGRTDLQYYCVGAGFNNEGKKETHSIAYYNPGVNYLDYGIQDTKSRVIDDNGSYISVYNDGQNPKVETLLGYHQLIYTGSTAAYQDKVTYNQYNNTRTGRSFRLPEYGNDIQTKYILGGRYFDIFPVATTTQTTNVEGYCGKWVNKNHSNACILFGSSSITPSSVPSGYELSLCDITSKSAISSISMQRLTRVLIYPNNIIFAKNKSEYLQL